MSQQTFTATRFHVTHDPFVVSLCGGVRDESRARFDQDPNTRFLCGVGRHEYPRHYLHLMPGEEVERPLFEQRRYVPLYAEFNDTQNICRDGVTRMTLTREALRVRFSKAADMRRGDTAEPFGRRREHIQQLAVRFPAGARWAKRLDAALGRLCARVSSYEHTPFDGSAGLVVFQPPRVSRNARRAWRRREERKRQLLQAAAAGDRARVAALLARSRLDPNFGDLHNWGCTPLLSAAGAGWTAVVRLLLDYGAQIDAQDAGHETALMAAAANGHTEVVKLLLERGADIHIRGEDLDRGFDTGSALTKAMRRGHTEIAALLRAAGAEE